MLASESVDGSTLECRGMDVSMFLSNIKDSIIMRTRMEVIVSHILVENIQHFKENYHDVVIWHIPHDFSDKSEEKGQTLSHIEKL